MVSGDQWSSGEGGPRGEGGGVDGPPTMPGGVVRPTPESESRAWRGVVWLVIACAVGVIIWMQAQAMRGVGLDEAPPDPSQVSSFELRFMGRYAIGWREAEGWMGGAPPGQMGPEDMLASFGEDAEDPISLIRVGVLASEVAGVEEGEAHLAEAAALLESGDLSDMADGSLSEEELSARVTAREGLGEDIRILREHYAGGALSDAERKYLVTRHGWFGELALAHGLDEGHPKREAIAASGVRTLIGAILFITVVLLGIVAGFALCVVAIVMLATRRVRNGFAAGAGTVSLGPSALEGFALFLVAFIGLDVGLTAIASAFPDAVWLGTFGVAANWALALCALWPLVRGVSWRDLSLAQGWTRGRGVWREAGAGVVAYLAGLPLVLGALVVMFIMMALMPETKPSHPAIDALAGAGWVEVLVFLQLGVMWAPIVEESMFRGLLYHDLRRVAHPVVAGLVTGFIFAIIHPQGITTVPVLMTLGFNFAMIREWRGCLIGPIVAHALHNGTLLGFVTFMMS